MQWHISSFPFEVGNKGRKVKLIITQNPQNTALRTEAIQFIHEVSQFIIRYKIMHSN